MGVVHRRLHRPIGMEGTHRSQPGTDRDQYPETKSKKIKELVRGVPMRKNEHGNRPFLNGVRKNSMYFDKF